MPTLAGILKSTRGGGDPIHSHDTLSRAARKLRLHRCVRHVFICTGGKCAPRKRAKRIAKSMRKRLRDSDSPRGEVLVTEVDCFKLCRGGPLLVVYPEGTWYGRVSDEELREIVQNHLLGGCPDAAQPFLVRPLKSPESEG